MYKLKFELGIQKQPLEVLRSRSQGRIKVRNKKDALELRRSWLNGMNQSDKRKDIIKKARSQRNFWG